MAHDLAEVFYKSRRVAAVYWDAHNPGPGKWTATQQMSLRGKREKIELSDFIQFAKDHSLATFPKIKSIIEQVAQSIRKWPQFAEQAKVNEQTALKIQTALGASFRESTVATEQ
jgi:hypothetical protein